LLDLPDALGLDIEYTSPARLSDGMYGLPGGAIKVGRKLGGFDEGVLCEEGLELFDGDKVVLFAVGLSRTGCSGGV